MKVLSRESEIYFVSLFISFKFHKELLIKLTISGQMQVDLQVSLKLRFVCDHF